ncbi:MAG: bacteriohemerythrin [Desulfobaccales bacterium]
MPFIWDKFYNIGLKEIDAQHESFINLLNRVNESYENTSESLKNDEDKMKMYLDILNLRKYALNHFLTEENYMISSKYPKYFEHKKQHDAFIKKIFELEEEVLNSQELSPQKLISFMLSWFEGHIQKVDKEFGNYYKVMVGVKS